MALLKSGAEWDLLEGVVLEIWNIELFNLVNIYLLEQLGICIIILYHTGQCLGNF